MTSLPRGINLFVLDACSRDHTLQFARAAGARVVQREWTDFLDARRFALGQVQTSWTLMIDADEALDDVLRDAIMAAPDSAEGYRVKRTTYYCGKPLRMWRNEPLLRLFRTDRVTLHSRSAASVSAPVHEYWSSGGNLYDLSGTLLHYSYPDAATYRAKYDRYTNLEANSVKASPLRFLAAWCAVLPRFGWLLFARGALLDGPRGWYVAYKSALYPAVTLRKAFGRKLAPG